MSQEFTVRWKVQMNSLPLSNQNFPKRTNHIPGLSRTTFISKDFQRPEFAAFKLKYQYFQERGGSLAHYLKADWKKKNCKSIPITDPNYPLVNFLQIRQSFPQSRLFLPTSKSYTFHITSDSASADHCELKKVLSLAITLTTQQCAAK